MRVRRKMIAGNWKMHGTKASVQQLLQSIQSASFDKLDLVVFPPFVYLAVTEKVLTGSHVKWGGQTMNEHQSGAFTGEVSAAMLKEFGCRYVLLGHSERRNLFHETNEQVAKQYASANQAGLTPVVCVGEHLKEREADQTIAVIRQQLKPIVDQSGVASLKNAVIAYEPVWAIGTGVTATPSQAQAVHAAIREYIGEYDKNIAEALTILYGGSVKPDNAKELFSMPDVDGGLIGGASLDAHSFLEIAELCNN